MKTVSKCFNIGRVGAILILAVGVSSAHAEKSTQGRFLYAGDDDWDWASPLGTDDPCKLSRYGAMSWSALDWAEEGLDDVRGVIYGSPPTMPKFEKMEEFSKMRGGHTNYEIQKPEPGGIEKLMAGDSPPNLFIVMQNKGVDAAKLADEDVTSLMKFVKEGGRLVVLDDYRRYLPMLTTAIEEASKHPPLIKEPVPKEEVVPLDPKQIEKLVADLADEKFAVRVTAKDGLIKLGPGIFDHIDIVTVEDLEIRARLTQIRAALFPKKAVPTGNTPNERDYQMEIDRMTEVSEELTAAHIKHEIGEVRINKEGSPLPVLKLTFDPKS